MKQRRINELPVLQVYQCLFSLHFSSLRWNLFHLQFEEQNFKIYNLDIDGDGSFIYVFIYLFNLTFCT